MEISYDKKSQKKRNFQGHYKDEESTKQRERTVRKMEIKEFQDEKLVPLQESINNDPFYVLLKKQESREKEAKRSVAHRRREEKRKTQKIPIIALTRHKTHARCKRNNHYSKSKLRPKLKKTNEIWLR